ncbi:hypothetical protein ACFYTF_11085 [Nocardia thailandica]|uniref:Uncharacterized protein n=1 Tax=Nocardia thailandica TaxID=257275 RepID=A0ABW6PLV0_9NOCA
MRISLWGGDGGLEVRMRFDQDRRRWLAIRIMLTILVLQGLVVGLWAVLAPHSWYTSFPGFGSRWVAVDGPYNQHLAADVGAFFLALAAVSAFALWRPVPASVRAAGLGWLVFGLPHLIYHATHHPHGLGGVGYAISLVGALALPALGLACVLVVPDRVPLPDPAPLRLRLPGRRRDTGRGTANARGR